jgi:hypothetical protein
MIRVNALAYMVDLDPDKEVRINVQMLGRAVQATQCLAPNLRFVLLPTGTKVGFLHFYQCRKTGYAN